MNIRHESSKYPVIVPSNNNRPLPSEFAFSVGKMGDYAPNHPDFYLWLKKQIEHAQIFDFGTIDNSTLRAQANLGGALFYENHLKLPYRACIFWYTVIIGDESNESVYEELIPTGITKEEIDTALAGIKDGEKIQYATVAVDIHGVAHSTDTGEKMDLWVADFVEDNSSIPEHYRNQYKTLMNLFGAGVFKCANTTGWYGGHEAGGSLFTQNDSRALGSIVDGAVGLAMILATKGIPLSIDRPSEKLQAKRARSGKAPLVPVTYVNTAYYYQARENTHRGGHHASPVPHLRRGHLRTLSDGRLFKSGKSTKWIESMIINCRSLSEVQDREKYEVKHP